MRGQAVEVPHGDGVTRVWMRVDELASEARLDGSCGAGGSEKKDAWRWPMMPWVG